LKIYNILTSFTKLAIPCLCLVFLSNYSLAETKPNNTKAEIKEKQSASPLPIETLLEFSRAFARIKNDYVEEIDDKTILTNAIKGMLSGLDPHSTYLDDESYSDLKEGTSGEFGGLGMEVGMEDGFIKVISPIDDTPAERAGIKSGDLIVRIEEKSTRGLELNEAVKLMRGKPGSKITISIMRENIDKPLDITIKRAIIKVSSVKSKLIEKNYGYLRVSSFQSRTAKQLTKQLKQLVSENKKQKLKGLVLDLRNNPGGILKGAIDVSNAFLNKGLIVYTNGRAKDSELKFSASAGDILDGAPIVVLVNNGSASASEIVAGALQDHKRAIIMGSQTFGKGSVQSVLPMSEKTAIKLTTARYYTPSGVSIQAEGITPDIRVGNWKLEKNSENNFGSVKETDLNGFLKNKKSDKKKHSKKNQSGTNGKIEEALKKDYALHEAMNILKGLNVLQP
jgi:carboxyl-terminal processing protease